MLLLSELLTVVFLGLVLGSFSTALIYRVPKKLPWGKERSACTNCKKPLRVVDLVPVFSWLSTGGRCRYCQVSVSYIYPLIEMSCVIMCVMSYFVFGLTYEALYIYAVIPFLLALFVIDLRHMILPNQLVFIVLAIGVIRLFYFSVSGVFDKAPDLFVTYFLGAAFYALLAWLTGFLITRVLKKDSLGFGDVKFFFVSGIWLGLYNIPYFLIFSGILGIGLSLFWRQVFKKEVFPFGPALITSFFVLLLFQGSFLT